MRCPKCQLENPPTALRCDCGYDFASGQMKASYLTGAPAVPPEKPSRLLEASAVALVLLNMLLYGLTVPRSARGGPELLGEVAGAMFAPAGMALLAIGIARLMKKGATRRSRAKIVLVTMTVALLGRCGSLTTDTRHPTGSLPSAPRTP